MSPCRHPHLDPRRWAPHGEWTPEIATEAIARMPGFARDFFARLFIEFPHLRGEVVFLRWSEQPGDVYAFFDYPPGFAIQIDPHLEYVIVFDRCRGHENAQRTDSRSGRHGTSSGSESGPITRGSIRSNSLFTPPGTLAFPERVVRVTFVAEPTGVGTV